MPIANDIWIEPIRPDEDSSIVASFVLADQTLDDPARTGKPFQMPIEGIGDVAFNFVCCIKGQAIYSASLPDQVGDQDRNPVRAELLCRELLREAL